MNPTREYTVKENLHYSHTKNHRLVRAACAKGLTNVKITWYSLKEYIKGAGFKYGWYLSADQTDEWHIGYSVSESEARIKIIPEIREIEAIIK